MEEKIGNGRKQKRKKKTGRRKLKGCLTEQNRLDRARIAFEVRTDKVNIEKNYGTRSKKCFQGAKEATTKHVCTCRYGERQTK